MTNPFANYLSSLLSTHGAAAALSRRSGVATAHISKLADGKVLPSVDMLGKLLSGLPLQADRDHLALEYALLHVSEMTPNVRVVLNDEASPRDRLTRACELLDPKTREALAAVVEAVGRAPELGAQAIQSLAALVGATLPGTQRGQSADREMALLAEAKAK